MSKRGGSRRMIGLSFPPIQGIARHQGHRQLGHRSAGETQSFRSLCRARRTGRSGQGFSKRVCRASVTITSMKAFTLTLLAVTLARMLCAAEPKSISTSPDGKYSIAVEQDEQLGLVFRWWQLQPEHLLLQIKSSYQPASPNDTSARVDTEAAQVHWSSDSRFVAIDEYNLRFKGAVFAATLTAPEKAEQLNI